ncbi:hypothetical protein Q8I65_10780 [Paenibacillus ottowii]|nr:hypothetical protein [Paenibacillus ottowii]MDP1510687.1 hypothetical protein [Paenibacillus ottowii]
MENVNTPELRPTYDTVHLNGSIGENNGGPVEPDFAMPTHFGRLIQLIPV